MWCYKYNFNKISIINSINKNGIIKNTREVPNENSNDLNRVFQSDKKEYIKKLLKKEINDHDIIIDIHSSPKCDNFMLLNQDEKTNSYVKYCKENDINYLIRYSSSKTIKKYSSDMGKVSFTLELNQLDYIDYHSANEGVNIILSIVKNNDIIIKKEEPKYKPYVDFKTHKSGLFIPNKDCGDIVKCGDKLGYIMDLDTIYRIVCFGVSNYVDSNNSICFL